MQPIALANVPVFRLNRRCRTLIETDNFGPVIQVEVGALAVGGIVNERENEPVKKGETMGHFSLMGSTIVLLLEKGRMELNPAIAKVLATGTECPVKMGEWIGEKIDS